MRNSTARHNWSSVTLMLLAVSLPPFAAAEPFRIGREDIIELRADSAWEDEAPDVVHFSGRFEMRVRDWVLLSDRATVHGPLEDPDFVEVEGQPARMQLARGTEDQPKPITAEALRIVYEREGKHVLLEGAAVMVQGESTLRSNLIEYELETDRLHASGESGVRMRLPWSKSAH